MRSTPFEIVQAVKNDLNLGVDEGDVRYNLVLPRQIEIGAAMVMISWRSDNKTIINDEGHVNRPLAGQGSVAVVLTATLTYSGTEDYRDFFLTVTELPLGDLALVEEAAANLVLWPLAKLDRDLSRASAHRRFRDADRMDHLRCRENRLARQRATATKRSAGSNRHAIGDDFAWASDGVSGF
ncbi:MAG: hypothetical protein MZU97_26310 [Bacillus subtilis]|nr:hypothetical protein [Bacillus subtilis]